MKCACRILVAVAALLAMPARPNAATLTVFAAASLTDSLREIGAAYGTLSGDKVFFNFAASSLLARQIEAGAPADLFFSADEAQMTRVEVAGLVVTNSRHTRLSNQLVIVVAAEDGAALNQPKDLAGPGIKRIALADPQTVPAGVYARQYLDSLGLWKTVQPKVIPCENVRAALAAVEAGNAEAGVVYRTDAAISKKVRVAYEVPREAGSAIRYPVAVLKDSRHLEAARKFLDFLDSESAATVFRKAGFVVLEPSRP